MSAHTFRIRDSRGTYYRGGNERFPAFGAKRDEAWTTKDGHEALRVMSAFPMAVLADLVNERDKRCDVTGKAIR